MFVARKAAWLIQENTVFDWRAQTKTLVFLNSKFHVCKSKQDLIGTEYVKGRSWGSRGSSWGQWTCTPAAGWVPPGGKRSSRRPCPPPLPPSLISGPVLDTCHGLTFPRSVRQCCATLYSLFTSCVVYIFNSPKTISCLWIWKTWILEREAQWWTARVRCPRTGNTAATSTSSASSPSSHPGQAPLSLSHLR